MFGKVVFGVDDSKFDEVLEAAKKKQSVEGDSDLNEKSLKSIVEQYKQICDKHTGGKFPTDPTEQVELAIKAVLRQLDGRKSNSITERETTLQRTSQMELQ